MKTRPFLIHALTSLHAGTGEGEEVIDLPIARQRATGIPIVAGSSIKGVLRDTFAARVNGDERRARELLAVFGPAQNDSEGGFAGALVVGDARLLALPVRSYRGIFAWVTSPLLLRLAARDLANAPAVPVVPLDEARVPSLEGPGSSVLVDRDRELVELANLELVTRASADVEAWSNHIAAVVADDPHERDFVATRFVVVDDEAMALLWTVATQLDTRVSIDDTTMTAKHGGLWVEESLPPETLLIGLFAADRSRKKDTPLTDEDVLSFVTDGDVERVVQLGGKASIGRGVCRLLPVDVDTESRP